MTTEHFVLRTGRTVTQNAQEKLDPAEVVMVTGASSGIGEATAIALAEPGYRVLAGVGKAVDASPAAPPRSAEY